MCLMHLRYISEVKILKIFTTFALTFIGLYISATKSGGGGGYSPPRPTRLHGACIQTRPSQKMFTIQYHRLTYHTIVTLNKACDTHYRVKVYFKNSNSNNIVGKRTSIVFVECDNLFKQPYTFIKRSSKLFLVSGALCPVEYGFGCVRFPLTHKFEY